MSNLPPALILAAGLGTRLHPLTTQRAKPALPVAGEPLIRRLIASLVAQGVREVVINLHHRPETISGVVGDGSDLGCRVRYSWESRILGSAGGPRRALPLLDARFFVLNGDTLCDVDLDQLARTHRDRGASVTLATTPNPAPDRYGALLSDDGTWVNGVRRAGAPGPEGWHFVGVQLAEATPFTSLDDGVPAATIGGLYDRLWVRPGQIGLFRVSGPFHDIGTPLDYLETSRAIADRERRSSPLRGDGCQLDPTAELDGSVLWDRVQVGARCRLTDCILGDDVHVPDDTRLTRQAVVPWSPEVASTGPGRRDGALWLVDLDRDETRR